MATADLPLHSTEAASDLELAMEASDRGALQKPEELAMVLPHLRAMKARRVLEIGTFEGGTAWLWRQVVDEVVTLDIGEPRRREDNIRYVQGNSHDPNTRDRVRAGRLSFPYDFVFIDGDHSFHGVVNDWLWYGPMGRLVGFHDINAAPTFGVTMLWRMLWGTRPNQHVITSRRGTPWGGIGLTPP